MQLRKAAPLRRETKGFRQRQRIGLTLTVKLAFRWEMTKVRGWEWERTFLDVYSSYSIHQEKCESDATHEETDSQGSFSYPEFPIIFRHRDECRLCVSHLTRVLGTKRVLSEYRKASEPLSHWNILLWGGWGVPSVTCFHHALPAIMNCTVPSNYAPV